MKDFLHSGQERAGGKKETLGELGSDGEPCEDRRKVVRNLEAAVHVLLDFERTNTVYRSSIRQTSTGLMYKY